MLDCFTFIHEFSYVSVLVRIFLAAFCGGLIGWERELKRRTAGFRTHILICIGASITTLTSQYLVYTMGYYTDIGRLGAQVVAGMGFIGAGTIIVARNERIKGLTTAAGLWASAIIGLALGSGFVEVGFIATLLVLLVEGLLVRWEYTMLEHVKEINLYMEYSDSNALESVFCFCREKNLVVMQLEYMRKPGTEQNASVILRLRLNKSCTTSEVLNAFHQIDRLTSIEEL